MYRESVDLPDMSVDRFYSIMLSALDQFYPTKQITLTSNEPYFVTPKIKLLFRKKNKLIRLGRQQEADTIAARIGKYIEKKNSTYLSNIHLNSRAGVIELWTKVRSLTRANRQNNADHQLTASELNTFFAEFSTDLKYVAPLYKSTVLPTDSIPQFTDMNIFNILANLSATATGLDQLPAWFLQLGALFFAAPIAYIFNTFINHSFVPKQWKTASP